MIQKGISYIEDEVVNEEEVVDDGDTLTLNENISEGIEKNEVDQTQEILQEENEVGEESLLANTSSTSFINLVIYIK